MAAHFAEGSGRTLSAEGQLHTDILAAAQKLSLDAYIKFLRPLLEPSSRSAWDAVSLTTAIHRLSKLEGDINEQPDLAGVFELVAIQVKILSSDFEPRAVGGVLYGLNNIRTEKLDPSARHALIRLIEAVVEAATRSCELFDSQHIGMAFYGLHGIRTKDLDDSGRSVVADVLALLARKTKACPQVMNAQDVAMAFYGLQNIRTSDLDESGKTALAKVLGALAPRLDTCPQTLGSQAVVQVFRGLKGIDASTFNSAGREALRHVLESLGTKLRASKQWLQPEDVESAIEVVAKVIGTPCEDDLNQEAIRLHAVLAEKLNKRTDGLELGSVLKAVASLQRFDTASLPAHLRNSLAVSLENLADAAERCLSASLNAMAIANAFLGLQGMETGCLDEASCKALVRLIKVLTAKTRECEERFGSQTVAMAFFGLQGIDEADLDDYGRNALGEALAALTAKTTTSSEPLDLQCVRMTFVGIRGLLPSEPRQITPTTAAALTTRVLDAAKAVLSQITGTGVRSAAEAGMSANALRILHDMNENGFSSVKQDLLTHLDAYWSSQSSHRGSVDDTQLLAFLESQQAYALYGRPLPVELAALLTSHDAECQKLFSPTPHEKECQWELEGLLITPVRLNQLVDGFELDVVFELDGRLYNVESDGPKHLKLSQKLKDRQRDAFLRSKGYEIIRVPSGLSPQQVAEQVLEHVAGRS